MKGSIQPGIEKGKVQVCPVCGSQFVHADPKVHISPLFCPRHPNQAPTRYRAKFGSICRHFDSYKAAEMELVGLNYKRAEGEFDPRDYRVKDKPLAFDRLAEEWLGVKKFHLKPGGWGSIRDHLGHAINAWGRANIKSIQYHQVENLLNALPFASKTKLNILNTLKQFWKWAAKAYRIPPLPDWPELGHVEMAFRKTVGLDIQEAIINNIKEHEPFRVWLCVKWLATYISIRPSEMLSIPEGDIDRTRGFLIVRNTKERNTKLVPLTPADQELVRELPLAFNPTMPFFRHDGRRGHTKFGGRFSRQMIWAAWKRACARLGVEGIDLYGGTKHSTAVGVRKLLSYEEVRKMTGHTTNKAFDRYIQLQGEALRDLYVQREAAISDHVLTTKKRPVQTG